MAGTKTKSTRKPEEPKTLIKADAVTMALTADKLGNIRANCASFETPAVILPGQCLEVRWQSGQVVMVKRELKK